jgi:hypothetical protein
MQYYIFDEVSPNLDAPYLELPDEIDLIESIMGKKPVFDTLPIKIYADIDEDEDTVYTDIINPGVPLFSDKMKSALDAAGIDSIEYYPVQLVDSDTKEVLTEYWLAVVLKILACIDLEHSEFKPTTSGTLVINKFSIDQDKVVNTKLFRLHNIPGLIIIDETLKDALSKIAFEGVSFKRTETYDRAL